MSLMRGTRDIIWPRICGQPAWYGRAFDAAGPAVPDLLRRGLNFVQRSPASLRALDHFEVELCRILGVHDARGNVAAIDALASLCGVIPASRAAALRFLTDADNRLQLSKKFLKPLHTCCWRTPLSIRNILSAFCF